ncbi:MAG: nucleotidyltransferase family protein [Cyanobacteria bacterium J06621_11]
MENTDQENGTLKGKVENKRQVFSRLLACGPELHRLGVSRCGVFGSFARDVDISEESDVDILVTFLPELKTFDNFMALSFLLEERLGRAVDLITDESLSPYIGPHILKEVEYVFPA